MSHLIWVRLVCSDFFFQLCSVERVNTLTLDIYIEFLSVVALDETNISDCFHFSMKNIEMSCDLDRAIGGVTSTSANNVFYLSTFA